MSASLPVVITVIVAVWVLLMVTALIFTYVGNRLTTPRCYCKQCNGFGFHMDHDYKTVVECSECNSTGLNKG